jgi:hypothetical protein
MLQAFIKMELETSYNEISTWTMHHYDHRLHPQTGYAGTATRTSAAEAAMVISTETGD